MLNLPQESTGHSQLLSMLDHYRPQLLEQQVMGPMCFASVSVLVCFCAMPAGNHLHLHLSPSLRKPALLRPDGSRPLQPCTEQLAISAGLLCRRLRLSSW